MESRTTSGPPPPPCKSYAHSGCTNALRSKPRLANAAGAAAEAQVPSEADYARLREVACALNERERWAAQEEFDAAFPGATTLDAIDELAHQPGLREAAPSPSARHERLRGLLLELCGWATGIDAADQASKPHTAT